MKQYQVGKLETKTSFVRQATQEDTEVILTQKDIVGMKKQFKQRMANLTAIANDSPFLKLSAETAIDHYAKIANKDNDRKIDKKSFEAATALLASQNQIQADKAFIEKMFTTLDTDENGSLKRAEWASAIPLFFGGSGAE